MTTIARSRRGASARFLSLPVPVELAEPNSNGNTWVKLAEGWVKITSMKNLWELDGYREPERPVIRMHFKATTEDGRTLLLFQDILARQWYCEFTLGSGNQEGPVPIYRA